MPNLYFEDLNRNLRQVCEDFDHFCVEEDIPYQIEGDNDTGDQINLKASLSFDQLSRIKQFASERGIVASYNDQELAFSVHNESVGSDYELSGLPYDVADALQGEFLRYMGERNRAPLAEHFKNFVLPVRIHDIPTLWRTHLGHPRWNELGANKSQYVGTRDKFPPVVVDTTQESEEYPAGRLIDGFRRLYAAHEHGDPMIEALDVKDAIHEANKITEDQYKSPTRRHIRKQSSFPSSFRPSRSFGGVSGYGKYSKKKAMREEYQHVPVSGKVTKDLLAHDNSTIIPAGSVIRIVDNDAHLPDVEFEGKIINVDRCKLEEVFKPTVFGEQLDKALMRQDQSEHMITTEDTELEEKLSETMGGTVSIVEPDILATISTKLSEKEEEDATRQQDQATRSEN
jgi:hypothetical protein